MKGLIKILAFVMIFLSIGINTAQAQFVGTFWVLPIDTDFPVGTKVVQLSRMEVRDMLSHQMQMKDKKLTAHLFVNGTSVELTLNHAIGVNERCNVYEGQEGNRVHVLFYTPTGDRREGKVIYSYYDIPLPLPNPEQEMLDAARQQGIGE